MKLIPLQQYICDECGQLIESVDAGWLEWLIDESGIHYGFRIVHHATSSPRKTSGRNCYYEKHLTGDMHLAHFVATDGLAKLLSMFDRPQKNMEELIDIVRRLHIPQYEEARQYWKQAEEAEYFSGANEYWPFMQENLTRIIANFSH
jgi:hypothetical protein